MQRNETIPSLLLVLNLAILKVFLLNGDRSGIPLTVKLSNSK
jgi:hypothetical protein